MSVRVSHEMLRPTGLYACALEFHLDLPLPLNLIVKAASWVWQRVTRVLLYKTYVGSHRKWSSRHQLGSRWEPLGDYLEYSLRLAQPTDHEPHVSKLALRSTGQRLSNVDLYFEARGAGVRYQDRISVCDVDRIPMIWNLINVPVLEFVGGPQGEISFSVEEVELRQCVVKLSSGEVLPPCNTMRSYLSQSWLVSDEWVYQWGHWWNCNAIKFAKGEIAIYWRLCFGFPKNRVYSPYATGPRRKPVIQPFLRGIGWIMALPPLVTVQFWFAIWSGLFVMDRDDRLNFRWKAGKNVEVDTA